MPIGVGFTPVGGARLNLSDSVQIYWLGHDGFGTTSMRHDTVSPPGANGDFWFGMRSDVKLVTLDLLLKATSEIALDTLRETLISRTLLKGVLDVTQDGGAVHHLNCVLAEELPMPRIGTTAPGALEVRVRFRSTELPFWFAPTPLSSTAPVGTTSPFFPMVFPFRVVQSAVYAVQSINNTGHVSTPVEITLVGPGSAPIVYNVTTGKRLMLPSLILAAGQTLTINTHPYYRAVQVNGVDAWDKLTTAEFWQLEPGINTVEWQIAGTTPSTVATLRWYVRKKGI